MATGNFLGTYAGDAAATAAVPVAWGALATSIFYFDSISSTFRQWSGSAWTASPASSLSGVIFVDTGIGVYVDGTMNFPYHDIAAAIAAASAGSTVLIAPGTYTITVGFTSKAGVKLQGYGCGGSGATATGGATIFSCSTSGQVVLTVNTSGFEATGIRFLVGDTNAQLPWVTNGGGGALFQGCHFRSTVNSDTPAVSSDNAAVTYESCTFASGNAGNDILSTSIGSVVTMRNCQILMGELTIPAGTVTLSSCDLSGGTNAINLGGASALTVYGGTVSGATYGLSLTGTSSATLYDTLVSGGTYGITGANTASLIMAGGRVTGNGARGISTTGTVTLDGVTVIVGGTPNGYGLYLTPGGANVFLTACVVTASAAGAAVYFVDAPSASSYIENCILSQSTVTPALTVPTGVTVTLARFQGNATLGGKVTLVGTGKLICAANTTKYVGGNRPDAFATVAGALAGAADGDVIDVAPGTYAEDNLSWGGTGKLTIRGSTRLGTLAVLGDVVSFSPVAIGTSGTVLAFTVGDAQTVYMQDLGVLGVITLSGSVPRLTINGCWVEGQLRLTSTSGSSSLRVMQSTIMGGGVGVTAAVAITNASPALFVYNSRLRGFTTNPNYGVACYWDVANSNTWFIQSLLLCGDPAVVPFGRNGAITMNTRVLQCRGTIDPIVAGWTNLVGTPYNLWDTDIVA